jgi:hypothetical protein
MASKLVLDTFRNIGRSFVENDEMTRDELRKITRLLNGKLPESAADKSDEGLTKEQAKMKLNYKSTKTIDRLVDNGKLHPMRSIRGRAIRFSKLEVESLLKN